MAMNIIIVDDEVPALEELSYMLKSHGNLSVIGTYDNPLTALQQIILKEPDAVFLDINMPEMDGFALAEQLLKLRRHPMIVFVTAYDQYAVNAFELNAVDYILKPILEDRLEKTMARLEQNLSKKTVEQPSDPKIEAMLKSHRNAHPISKLPLWKGDRIHLVSPSKIICCIAEEGGTRIHTTKETYISQDSLNQLETLLSSEKFFRCHRSYLINLDAVETVIPWFNNTYAVKMAHTDLEIPISRRNMKEFKEIFHI